MLSDRIPSKADIRLIRSLGQKKFREELGLEPGPEIVAIYEESMGFKRS